MPRCAVRCVNGFGTARGHGRVEKPHKSHTEHAVSSKPRRVAHTNALSTPLTNPPQDNTFSSLPLSQPLPLVSQNIHPTLQLAHIMPNNNRNRPNFQLMSTGSLVGAAVGLVVGLAAVEHAQAQTENRESFVQGVVRWFREDVLELPSGRTHPSRVAATARRILTRSDISALPVRTLVDDDIMSSDGGEAARGSRSDKAFCVICHDPYSAGDSLMRLPCFHEYHVDCIKDYLESTENPLCPVCRHPVVFS